MKKRVLCLLFPGFEEIETICASRRIDYLRTTTQVPFDDFVLQMLRRVSSVA